MRDVANHLESFRDSEMAMATGAIIATTHTMMRTTELRTDFGPLYDDIAKSLI